MIERLQAHYGFTRMPFGRDLAPGMLHRHAGHGEAVARISWCVAERALGVITGEVGAGKTVAVRTALAALDTSRHTVIYLPNPPVGVRGIHHASSPPSAQSPPTATPADRPGRRRARRRTRRTRPHPRPGHRRSPPAGNDQLEAIRMLTNHDMDSGRPFACLLIGQPTLRRLLKLGRPRRPGPTDRASATPWPA